MRKNSRVNPGNAGSRMGVVFATTIVIAALAAMHVGLGTKANDVCADDGGIAGSLPPATWGAAGSSGVPDEVSGDDILFNGPHAALKDSFTGSATLRYNVTQLPAFLN